MSEISLRIARLEDVAAMVRLQRASWRMAYGSVLGEEVLEQMDEAAHHRVWERRLTETDPRPMLICLEEQPVGLLYWQQEGDLAWLRAFYLDPDIWRQGLGRRLWQVVMVQMRRAGCREARLWLLGGNRIGAGFYFKHGFRPTGERRTLQTLGRDCVQHQLARPL